ncbi:tetraspanin-8-like [Poeciliopsis prolifica]|uniref:tetraspanin-8-like n=1 Tax=Poeciliopsis prolifica TaxID=188132 RepID=UPI0024140B4D|nr:tetraspanin-8-like [Poeciliopsis prolifica]
MAQINSCLKRTFIGFNLFFALVGAIILCLAVVSQVLTSNEDDEMGNRTTGLICLYIMGTVTTLLGLLGAYGAYKEHKISLIVFLICMVIGSLFMLRSGIPTAILRPQVQAVLEEKFREMLPLNRASIQEKHVVDSLQTHLHCCGLFSYTDWNEDIPSSCNCPSNEDEEPETCKVVSAINRYAFLMDGRSIYSKPCAPIVMYYVLLMADISLGVVFTLAILAVLGMILSSIMIHQLRHPNRTPVVLNIPTIFIPGPPKYEELQNDLPPPY